MRGTGGIPRQNSGLYIFFSIHVSGCCQASQRFPYESPSVEDLMFFFGLTWMIFSERHPIRLANFEDLEDWVEQKLKRRKVREVGTSKILP